MGARYTKYNFSRTYFYQLPKGLFINKKYAKLSSNAKIIYSILLDKISLSYSNGLFEENGDIFAWYKWEDMMELTGIAKTTFYSEIKKLKELGLIETVKVYPNLNKIYVNELDDAASEEDIVSDSIGPSKEAADEILEINAIASMTGDEMAEAMQQGRIGRRYGFSKIQENAGSHSELLQFGKRTPGISRVDGVRNPNHSSLYSGMPGSEYELNSSYSGIPGSESELAGSKSHVPSSESERPSSESELLYSKTNSKTNSYTISSKNNSKNKVRTISNTKNQEERKKEREGECARTRILEGNLSKEVLEEVVNPCTSTDSKVSFDANLAPVDNVDNSATGEGEPASALASDGFSEVYALYCENIQKTPVPLVKDSLKKLYGKVGKEILVDAITQAALSSTSQEKKGFYYVASIAERLAGKKNNFSVSPRPNDAEPMQKNITKKKSVGMNDSRKNIHSMIDNFFGKNETKNEVTEQDANRTGT